MRFSVEDSSFQLQEKKREFILLLKIVANSVKRKLLNMSLSDFKTFQNKMAANRIEKFLIFKAVKSLNYQAIYLKNG